MLRGARAICDEARRATAQVAVTAAAAQFAKGRRAAAALGRWAGNVHFLRVVRRAKARRLAARMRRGVTSDGRDRLSLRRGLVCLQNAARSRQLLARVTQLSTRARRRREWAACGRALTSWSKVC